MAQQATFVTTSIDLKTHLVQALGRGPAAVIEGATARGELVFPGGITLSTEVRLTTDELATLHTLITQLGERALASVRERLGE